MLYQPFFVVSVLLSVLCLPACGGGGGGGAEAAPAKASTGAIVGIPVLPSGPPAGTACPTAQSTVATGVAAQLALKVSRVSGVAPLAIHFDASSTTSTSTSLPFHELEYRWSFGESGSGTWNYGAKAGSASRNAASGPIAAHVFESAGTYPITVSVTNGVSTVSYSCNITVLDADAEFTGNKTVCVSGVGNFSGCPVGAFQVANSNATTAVFNNLGVGNKRILFHRGETFAVSSVIQINKYGPGILGSYGSGAKPILSLSSGASGIQMSSSATPGMADWRIMDLQFEGNYSNNAAVYGGGSMSDLLVIRNDIRNSKWGLSFSDDSLHLLNNSSYTHPIWSKIFIVDNTINDLVGINNGSNGMYIALERSAVMGNYVNPNNKGEHGIRASYESYTVFSHNEITGIPSGRAFLTLRSPDQGKSTFPTSIYGSHVYSEKNYVSDNKAYGGYTTGMSGVGPINSSSTGRSRDFIWERNLFEGSSTTTTMLTLSGSQITARNNLFNMKNAGVAINTSRMTATPHPTDLWVYNNSVYANNTGYSYIFFVSGGDMTGSTFTFKNNLFYGPSISTYGELIGQSGDVYASIVKSGNTLDANYATNPNFTSTPPTTTAHFKPLSGSYAINSGVDVPVWSDFFGMAFSGAHDIGAVRH